MNVIIISFFYSLELRILCANLPKDASASCYETVSARCYEACYKKKQYNF